MLKNCNKLGAALEQSISSIDNYIESLQQFGGVLEQEIRYGRFNREEQLLRLQCQSLLSTLLMLRDLNYQKLNLIKQYKV